MKQVLLDSHFCFRPEHERSLRNLMCMLENYFVCRTLPDDDIGQPTRDDCKLIIDCLFDIRCSLLNPSYLNSLLRKLS